MPFDMDISQISKDDALSLVGEAVSLPCTGALLYSVYINESAPWWSPAGRSNARDVSQDHERQLQQEKEKADQAASQRKCRRRTGAMNSNRTDKGPS